MVFSELYSLKEIKKRYSDIEMTEKQRNAVKEWLVLLDNNQLQKEEENYPNFMNIILRDLLSYPETEIQKGFEQNNVEFSFKDKDDKTVVVFEAKGTKTKDLFSKQDYGKKEQETPIIQTLTYMARIPARFGVTTNYKKFVLLDASEGDSKCHRFDFKDIENNHDRLREFIGIFSYSK
ncbi:MAG: hypothetical protein IS860_04135 [Nitrosopumilus sp.]|nr:hypothetical protein [Nitrosopumilus sp.]